MVYLLTMGWFLWFLAYLAHTSLAMTPEQSGRSQWREFVPEICRSRALKEHVPQHHPMLQYDRKFRMHKSHIEHYHERCISYGHLQ